MIELFTAIGLMLIGGMILEMAGHAPWINYNGKNGPELW